MMAKIASLLVAAACFAGAQDFDNYNGSPYDSKTDASAVEKANASAQQEEEPGALYIGIHPITLIIFTAIDAPMVYVTIEKPVTVTGSFMVKPGIFYMGEGFVKKYVDDEDGFEASYLAFEIGAGYRHYFKANHRGSYVEADLTYAHGSMEARDYSHKGTISANTLGIYALIGLKSSGPVIHSFDIGLSYLHTGATATGDINSNDVNGAAGSGFGLTGNYSISLGF